MPVGTIQAQIFGHLGRGDPAKLREEMIGYRFPAATARTRNKNCTSFILWAYNCGRTTDSESVAPPQAPATLEIACRRMLHDVVNSGHDSRRDIDIELNHESRRQTKVTAEGRRACD